MIWEIEHPAERGEDKDAKNKYYPKLKTQLTIVWYTVKVKVCLKS